MQDRLWALTRDLMLIPGLSGHEGRVRRRIAAELDGVGLAHRTDRLGNLIATHAGAQGAPSVMIIAHMDQLGFITRKIEANGLLRVERVGGAPERALLAQPVLAQIGEGRDLPGVIGAKSHHATTPEEKYQVVRYQDLTVDFGFEDAAAARAAGIEIGTPIVYRPMAERIGPHRLAGPAVDDRAACAVMVEAARALIAAPDSPTIHFVFSVQEEFNLRGALPAAQALQPDIALQLDLALAADTPDMTHRGEVALGAGPAMSLFSFHGRGTLNGLIPHPALTRHFSKTAAGAGLPLQRSVHQGALTETSYVQLVGAGVACLDLGFPMRYSHSAQELCDLRDLEGLTRLLIAGVAAIGPDFDFDRGDG